MSKNNSISQSKIRESLKKAGKVSINDYVLDDTKKKLKGVVCRALHFFGF